MTTQPFAIPALALFLVAVPLVLGWIPRNRFYGIRTAKTLSDDEVWYREGRAGQIPPGSPHARERHQVPKAQ